MTFDEILTAVVGKIAKSESFASDFLNWCIDPKDFPNSRASKLLSSFIENAKSNSVKFGQWKLLQNPEAEKYISANIPDTIAKHEFFSMLESARAEKLALDILKNPKAATELIKNFTVKSVDQSDVVNIPDIIERIDFERREAAAAGKSVKRIRNWFQLSDHIGGFNQGRIAICIAQSGFGKTNLAINLALSAQKTMNVFYVNMEMMIADIVERILAQKSGVAFSKLRDGADINSERIAIEMRDGGKLNMTTGRDKSLFEIESLLRSAEDKPELVVVDYDQKLILDINSQTPEWRALQYAMARFEELAKELKTFILILAQSNLEGEISGSHRSRFSASSIWSFERDEDLGPCLKFPKNRFGENNKCLLLEYESHCARISEKDLISIAPKKKKKI